MKLRVMKAQNMAEKPYKDLKIVLEKLNLEEHVKGIHNIIGSVKRKRIIVKPMNSDKFSCKQCSYKATKKSAFNLHVKAVHEKIKDWGCEQCSFTSAHRGALQRMHI